MELDAIFQGLNDEQRRAVEATRGPICILAGAGSGKTTTITRRIAHQVATGVFEPADLMAVTFTDRAAGEMRSRLATLGVEGVRARTFHSAAFAQLRHLGADATPQILASKAVALRQIGNTLPKPYKFRPAGDLATEIEWAKNRRIGPHDYIAKLGAHTPPIPPDLMASVYDRYESGKRSRNLIDFEDLLELTIQMFQTDDSARDRFFWRYKAFTVDEYQDVNLLQETLLREWIGERDDLCVVGDDYQSIYGFTGASPDYLLQMPGRFRDTKVIRLETNYRSTPEVLAVANKLVPNLGGAEKVLRAARPSGPKPMRRAFRDPSAETGFLVEQIKRLQGEGVPLEEMAILYRVNFRSEDYEEVLAAAGIPYRVTDGAFLQRQSARNVLSALRRSSSTGVAEEVQRLAGRAGYVEEPAEDLGEQELTRQKDLARLIHLALEFDDGSRTGIEFVAEIELRFGGGGEGRGVNLLTLHRAKGLEFEAVFLPRVEDGELPFKRSKTDEAIAEERRLFYVGLTRAKTHLVVTWVSDGRRKASTFVGEISDGGRPGTPMDKKPRPVEEIQAREGLKVSLSGGFSGTLVEVRADGATLAIDGGAELEVRYGDVVTAGDRTLPLGPPELPDDPVLKALKAWRAQRAKADEVPAYVVFHDKTLEAIAAAGPRSPEDLSLISGIGPAKLERYGSEILTLMTTG
ncbi:MAG TPA: ATP-dependent DNA helicase UvrD2 [Actinomycetota bacterium]|nr:ATP-dependent DNA helicase UvrD2 [Actinomycetota bacterium]